MERKAIEMAIEAIGVSDIAHKLTSLDDQTADRSTKTKRFYKSALKAIVPLTDIPDSCRCKFCGIDLTTAQETVFKTNIKGTFTDQTLLKTRDNYTCGYCYLFTESAGAFNQPLCYSYISQSGIVARTQKNESAYFVYENMRDEPFILTRNTTKSAHVLWISELSYSRDVFNFQMDKKSTVVNRANVEAAYEIHQKLVEKVGELFPPKDRPSSVLGGSFKNPKFTGTVSDYWLGKVQALRRQDVDVDTAKVDTVINAMNDFNAQLSQLTLGEVYFLHLCVRMRPTYQQKPETAPTDFEYVPGLEQDIRNITNK